MFLTGTFQRSLDEKLRFALPKPIRAAFEGTVYLTPGMEGALWLFPDSAFSQVAERLSQAPPAGQDVRTFQRLFFARTESQEMDAQGRVRLSAGLAQLAQIEKEIVLLGVRDHVEIWDRTRWDEFLEAQQSQFDAVTERVLGNG
ncbi:MAG: division/cell wall cluster transcriptional repressor MraZ [Planctomycetales bacterium]|nr:division/cell wall cluster transcriptional repressor MraZ [Planctomycetales bacterium]